MELLSRIKRRQPKNGKYFEQIYGSGSEETLKERFGR